MQNRKKDIHRVNEREAENHAGLRPIGRRAFLRDGALLLAAAGLPGRVSPSRLVASDESESDAAGELRIGLITDLHYADKPAAGSRFYRESLTKLAEAAETFEASRPGFVVELGDLIDAADSVETELSYLRRINGAFRGVAKDRHYVLGNHCVDTLTKQEFLGEVEQQRSYYSFDRQGWHFVVLDACFRSDGTPYQRKNSIWTDANIPAEELEWLRGDLAAGDSPTVVFAHQRLDVHNNHGVKNAADVRTILEGSRRVSAVFQGHSHRNDYHEIGGIHYCTLVAMVEGSGAENSGYSLLGIANDGSLRLGGYRKQKGYEWKPR